VIRLERVTAALPRDFGSLQAEARTEGHAMLDTLAAEWLSGGNRFDRPGEALIAAYADDALAGIGGLSVETALPGAFRMRRFYVRTGFRRSGIARALALALLAEIDAGRTLTCNAAAGSERFWEALGFVPDRRDGFTHIRTGRTPPR
jgi:GNAT superfamily N-acetyltransferase